MSQSSRRFRINTLIQLARITEDQNLREELVAEIQELLEEVENCNPYSEKALEFDEEIFDVVNEYLKDKYRICAVEIWQKALGKKGKPQKWQATEINNIISQIPGWTKMRSPGRFGEYEHQRGFKKNLSISESEE